MAKQYLEETNKCWRDAIWSLFLAVLATLYRDAPSFVYAIAYMIAWFAQIFVMVFLWSWKKEDAQSYRARCLLKVTCGFWFVVVFIAISSVLHNAIISGFNVQTIWALLPIVVITTLIVKKYYGLMYARIQ